MFCTLHTPNGPIGFHLHTMKPPRVVPGPERHRWNGRPAWGETATCLKCGCIKSRSKLDYQKHYTLPGHPSTTQRPPCPAATAAPTAPPAPPVPAAPASPAAAPAVPSAPTSLLGLTTTYDEPAPYHV